MDNEEVINQILFINKNISELSNADYIGILQILLNSTIDEKKIQEKGGGTQIKYKDIPPEIINNIYEYVNYRLKDKMSRLNTFTKEEIIV